MTPSDRSVQELLDREAIRDCVYRYCRGIDRLDEAALRSAYWPDATDCHGAYQGSADGFIAMALDKLRTAGRMVHFIGNILIELHGEVAAVESYFLALQEEPGPRETFLAGRYVDRFEKRGGEWRVAARTVTYDWQRQDPLPAPLSAEVFGARAPQGGRLPNDPLYALLAQVRAEGGGEGRAA